MRHVFELIIFAVVLLALAALLTFQGAAVDQFAAAVSHITEN